MHHFYRERDHLSWKLRYGRPNLIKDARYFDYPLTTTTRDSYQAPVIPPDMITGAREKMFKDFIKSQAFRKRLQEVKDADKSEEAEYITITQEDYNIKGFVPSFQCFEKKYPLHEEGISYWTLNKAGIQGLTKTHNLPSFHRGETFTKHLELRLDETTAN